MNMALIRRHAYGGTIAALMIVVLVLSACGGGPEPVVATPAAEEAAPPADDAGVEAGEEVTEPEEAGAETETEDAVTETEVITDTGVTETEALTETEVTTDTDVTTDTEVITGEEEMTTTEDMTDTEGMTETEDATQTEDMTDTEGAAETEDATGTGEAGAAAGAAATGAGVEGAEGGQVYATTLLDYNFENADGAVSGEIEDLFIDVSNGQILYVTIEYGGFLDIGDTQIAMPLNAFRIGEEGELVLNFDEASLENFPDMGGDWPNLEDPTWDDQLVQFWGEQGLEPATNFEAGTTSVVRASDLVGFPTADLGGGAGSIIDLIIDLGAGVVTYALVDLGAGVDAAAGVTDTALAGENVYAVPLNAFDFETGGDVLPFNADVTAETFASAPRFDRNVYLPDQPLDPAWHEEFDAFWRDLGIDVGGE